MEWKELQERIALNIYNAINDFTVGKAISLFIAFTWIICINILIWHLVAPSWLRWLNYENLTGLSIASFLGGVFLLIRHAPD